MMMMLEKEDLSLFDKVNNQLNDQSLNSLERRDESSSDISAAGKEKKKCPSYLILSENACCVCSQFFRQVNRIQMSFQIGDKEKYFS